MAAADNFFQKADQALKKRNYDYAIELYQEGLKIDPERLEERQKLRATAIRRCQEKGTSTVPSPLAKLKHGGTLGRIKKLGVQKKFEEQIIEIERYLAAVPQDSRVLISLGQAFEKTERSDSALVSYNHVLDVDPKNVEALKNRGRLQHAGGDLDAAIETWERVRAADPTDQEAGKMIRDLSAAKLMKQTEERRKGGDGSYRDLLKDTEDAAKLEKKAAIIRTADDAKTALDIKREEVEADAENPRQWRELGDLHLKANDYDGAREAYDRALQISPNDLYLKDRLGKLEERMRQHEVDVKRRALDENPGDAAAQAAYDEAVAKQKEFLTEELARQVAAHPTDFQLKYRYGELLLEAGRTDEAIGQFQAARKDPKYATKSNFRLGQGFAKKGLYGPAIQQYQASLDSLGDGGEDLSKEIRYNLGEALVENGDKPKALEIFESIMMDDIGYRDVSQRVDELRS